MPEPKKSLYEKIANVRMELSQKNLKKSGKNTYAGFDYFELKDFLPSIIELEKKHRLLSTFVMIPEYKKEDNHSPGEVKLIVKDWDSDEQFEVLSPIKELNKESKMVKGMHPVQALGAVHTFLKRYLYNNLYNITEDDVLDKNSGNDQNVIQKPQPKKAAPVKKIATITEAEKKAFLGMLNEFESDTNTLIGIVKPILEEYKITKLDQIPENNKADIFAAIVKAVKSASLNSL